MNIVIFGTHTNQWNSRFENNSTLWNKLNNINSHSFINNIEELVIIINNNMDIIILSLLEIHMVTLCTSLNVLNCNIKIINCYDNNNGINDITNVNILKNKKSFYSFYINRKEFLPKTYLDIHDQILEKDVGVEEKDVEGDDKKKEEEGYEKEEEEDYKKEIKKEGEEHEKEEEEGYKKEIKKEEEDYKKEIKKEEEEYKKEEEEGYKKEMEEEHEKEEEEGYKKEIKKEEEDYKKEIKKEEEEYKKEEEEGYKKEMEEEYEKEERKEKDEEEYEKKEDKKKADEKDEKKEDIYLLKPPELNFASGIIIFYKKDIYHNKFFVENMLKNGCILQKYVHSNKEYVCHCVCLNGIIKHNITYEYLCPSHIYTKSDNVISSTKIISDKNFIKIFELFLKDLNFTGICNFDYKIDRYNKPIIFEINPRMGGSLMVDENSEDLSELLNVLFEIYK